MANLETLELTINANAASATQGLSGLISSLSSLHGQVNNNVGALKAMNAELEKLSGIGRMLKMPSFTNNNLPVIGSIGKVKEAGVKAAESVKEAVEVPGTRLEALAMKYAAVNDKMEEYAAKGDALATANKRLQLDQVERQFEKEKAALDGADEKQKTFRQGLRDLGRDVSNTVPKFKALHKVLRIASTMLIRMGLRSLFKGVKEGFNNYYQYAKNTGKEFSHEMDNVSSAWAQLKNQMGAAIAPAIGAVIPILNGIASAAIAAFNALSQLFALLGGSGVWSKATAQVTSFDAAASKAGGGGGGLKEMLARFDELNVIAQEGGGGGGGGTTADEYIGMFEDMYEFDSKIQAIASAIKEVVGWVQDNLSVVLKTAELIGIAILGWKVSKAFEGALADIGKYVFGGAMLTIGILLDFDFGTKVGSGAKLSTMDWIEGIGGMLAAAIGGYLVAGTTGLAIGLGVTIIATVVGITMGAFKKSELDRWGKVTLSADQVKSYVQSKFKFDVYAEIELVGGELKNTRAAKAHLERDIWEFEQSLDKINLQIDTSDASIANLKNNIDTVVSSLDTYMKSSENMLTAYLQVMPYDESKETNILKDVLNANSAMQEYVSKKGAEIADLYDKGMKDQWSKNEKEQILALANHVSRIFNAMTNGSNLAKTKAALKVSIKGLSKYTANTAKSVLDEQKKILEDFRETMYTTMMEQVAELEGLAAAFEEMAMPEAAEKLRKDAQYLVENFEEATEQKLGEAKGSMKAEWTAALREIYSGSMSAAVSSLANTSEFRNALMKGSTDAARLLKEELNKAIERNPIVAEAAKLFGINGWDLLADNTKQKYIKTMMDAFGNDAIAALKKELNVPVSDIVKFSGYDTMATKEKLNFINAIVKAYGAQEALQAAKNAGINIVQAVNDGLNGKNPAAKAAATELVNAIDNALKNKGIKVPVNADLTVKVKTLLELNTKVTMEAIKKAVVQASNTTASIFTGGTTAALQQLIPHDANGAYGIASGDLFIANEAGAELVGSINGKTSVANQGQIIEGIQRGVAEANEEQNALLRQQNELLRGILEKETTIRLGASAEFGRTAKQSIAMYNGMVGG